MKTVNHAVSNYNREITIERNSIICQISDLNEKLSTVKLSDYGIKHGNVKLREVLNTLTEANNLKAQFSF